MSSNHILICMDFLDGHTTVSSKIFTDVNLLNFLAHFCQLQVISTLWSFSLSLMVIRDKLLLLIV